MSHVNLKEYNRAVELLRGFSAHTILAVHAVAERELRKRNCPPGARQGAYQDIKVHELSWEYGKQRASISDNYSSLEKAHARLSADFTEQYLLQPAPTGRITSEYPNMQQIPKAVAYNPSMPMPSEHVPVKQTAEELRKALAQAEADEAEAAAKAERAAGLTEHIQLCHVTQTTLISIQQHEAFGSAFNPSAMLVKHRTELKEVVEDYGYKIVLVGDKKQAMLVQK